MIVGDGSYVMLLVEDFFASFTRKRLCDARTHTEVIVALSAESRAGVDDLADRAVQAGAQPSNDPMDDGPMYLRSFQDLDGHLWEVFHLEPGAE